MKRLALVLVVPACAPDLPAEPAWGADVAPLLAANCVGCHGVPALGGAPAGFRLDRHTGGDGSLEYVEGAGEVLEFIRLRVDDGHGDLLDHQRELLARWDGQVGEPDPGNHRPAFTVRGVANPVRDAILIDYELRDPDFDLVEGELRADGVVVDRSLHAGRGTAGFSTTAFAAGEVRVEVVYSDGTDVWVDDLGRLPTGHDGDVSPRVAIRAPARHAILSDADVTTIVVDVADVDSPGPFTAEVRAVPAPGEPAVVVATGVVIPAGGVAIPWDTRELPAGDTWQVTVSAGDGAGSSGGASVDPLIVSHATSRESFASLGDLFDRCATCHDGERARLDLRDGAAARAARAAIYQRVIVERTMPPRSADLLGIAPLSDPERDRLAEWLLAGAL